MDRIYKDREYMDRMSLEGELNVLLAYMKVGDKYSFRRYLGMKSIEGLQIIASLISAGELVSENIINSQNRNAFKFLQNDFNFIYENCMEDKGWLIYHILMKWSSLEVYLKSLKDFLEEEGEVLNYPTNNR